MPVPLVFHFMVLILMMHLIACLSDKSCEVRARNPD